MLDPEKNFKPQVPLNSKEGKKKIFFFFWSINA